MYKWTSKLRPFRCKISIEILFEFSQLHEYEQIVDGSESKIKEAEDKLAANERSMESMKIHWNEEIQKVREHSSQLSEQNSLLHKEIEKVCF